MLCLVFFPFSFLFSSSFEDILVDPCKDPSTLLYMQCIFFAYFFCFVLFLGTNLTADKINLPLPLLTPDTQAREQIIACANCF